MKVGSLCSGIGGVELALGTAIPEAQPAWFCESDPAPATVLRHRFPGVDVHGDVRTLDWHNLEPVDVVTAGYPCQPFSQAGKRLGADDPRHLWPTIAEGVRNLRPAIVFLENVRGHVQRGLQEVIADLADMGYDAAWGCVRASDAGLPHRRERVFIVATDSDRSRLQRTESTQRRLMSAWSDPSAPNASGDGFSGSEEQNIGPQTRVEASFGHDAVRRDMGPYEQAVARWERFFRPAPDPCDEQGRLNPSFVEWMMGFPQGWVCDVLARRPALKALGNAVAPRQAILAWALIVGLNNNIKGAA